MECDAISSSYNRSNINEISSSYNSSNINEIVIHSPVFHWGHQLRWRRYEHVYNALQLELLACEAIWGVAAQCSPCMQLKNSLVRVKQASLYEAVDIIICILIYHLISSLLLTFTWAVKQNDTASHLLKQNFLLQIQQRMHHWVKMTWFELVSLFFKRNVQFYLLTVFEVSIS